MDGSTMSCRGLVRRRDPSRAERLLAAPPPRNWQRTVPAGRRLMSAQKRRGGAPLAARAARTYLDIAFFHPFADGNGHSALLALTFVLAWEGVILGEVGPLQVTRYADDPAGAADLVHGPGAPDPGDKTPWARSTMLMDGSRSCRRAPAVPFGPVHSGRHRCGQPLGKPSFQTVSAGQTRIGAHSARDSQAQGAGSIPVTRSKLEPQVRDLGLICYLDPSWPARHPCAISHRLTHRVGAHKPLLSNVTGCHLASRDAILRPAPRATG
ncbi:Fic family protein [Streptomyces albospinus]|uniref:Fic family protein n=1 Tax=Streptomyces albospinus TaxID=285515 RepID=UPI001670A9E2|nr:Fic family protein [Streptomyces albospinus]